MYPYKQNLGQRYKKNSHHKSFVFIIILHNLFISVKKRLVEILSIFFAVNSAKFVQNHPPFRSKLQFHTFFTNFAR